VSADEQPRPAARPATWWSWLNAAVLGVLSTAGALWGGGLLYIVVADRGESDALVGLGVLLYGVPAVLVVAVALLPASVRLSSRRDFPAAFRWAVFGEVVFALLTLLAAVGLGLSRSVV